MKKLIFLVAFLLTCNLAFAVDTPLNGIRLTDKQISQSEALKSDVIKGFSFWDDSVVVVSTRALTDSEKSGLFGQLSSLPDSWTQKAIEDQFDKIRLEGSVYQLFATKAIQLSPYFGALDGLLTFKNFSGCKSMIAGLASAGLLTTDEANSFIQLFMDQGIDLSKY